MGQDKAAFAALAKNKQKVISDRDGQSEKDRQLETNRERKRGSNIKKESMQELC